MGFELIPAIDLLGGRCVRLAQGRYDRATEYGDDPGAMAARFVAAGVRRLHAVDLDGARRGAPANREALSAIVAAAAAASPAVPVQMGGGIRSLDVAEEILALGVERVIFGTVALRDPALVRAAAAAFPGRVAVGIDAKEGRVAVEGWLEESETPVLELARRFEDAGVAAIVHTDIARDGMETGPNLEATGALARAISIPVIASGGVGSLDHVRAAARARGVAGVIVGRALYTGAVDLGEALEAVACA
ncbi:MAG TPA: 1-(5-phosphoribosyl)-5-[(5-phosphoribosylamino)methylideneamino]imidazole-4-carboxamide isomerase [Myxococcota bacterium]|nr:1-(5-phosphoribosyl)-5-[(5-phosphoribosylamino)methylideneamino]imidazole-4-carboxamide isomerase [Myxococcota bacterium]